MSATETLPSDTTADADDRPIDLDALEAFVGRMVGLMTGAAASLGVWLGDELGLYRRSPATVTRRPTGSQRPPAAIRDSSASGSTPRPPPASSPAGPTPTPTPCPTSTPSCSPTTSHRRSWPAA